MIIRYNKNHHVIEEHAYKPNLQDVPHPNLHRKIFTYGEIPKIAFNMRHVPMECPKDIYITDTTASRSFSLYRKNSLCLTMPLGPPRRCSIL